MSEQRTATTRTQTKNQACHLCRRGWYQRVELVLTHLDNHRSRRRFIALASNMLKMCAEIGGMREAIWCLALKSACSKSRNRNCSSNFAYAQSTIHAASHGFLVQRAIKVCSGLRWPLPKIVFLLETAMPVFVQIDMCTGSHIRWGNVAE